MKIQLKKQPASQWSSTELAGALVDACLDAKGRDVAVLDMRSVFDLSDYFIIVSGRSDRQVQGICNKLLMSMQDHGLTPDLMEGFDEGHWVILEFGEVLIHVFYEPLRDHYDIEGLWTRATKMRVSLGADGAVELSKAA